MQRIWIYQANRLLSNDEVTDMQIQLSEFAKQWKVHGKPLEASAVILDNLFVVLKVNEDFAAASGCSIDSSVRFLKEIEQKYHIALFDRMQIAFRNGHELSVVSRSRFEQLIQDGIIHDDTIVFDNSVTTDAEFNTRWAIPYKESWHKRVFG